jgi:hypothetical protein
METTLLTLHFCSTHDLLFFPSLESQQWLSFTPVQIEHAFGEVLSLTESTCPRCLPELVTSSVLLKASGF